MRKFIIRIKIVFLMILLLLMFGLFPFTGLLWIICGKGIRWNSNKVDIITDKIFKLEGILDNPK